MEKKQLKLGGLPWWQAVVAVILCALPMYLGVQSSSLTGTLCSMAALAIVLNELGERIPIWNTYIGGGHAPGEFTGTALTFTEEGVKYVFTNHKGEELDFS